ncbi:MAG: hypothetical protein HQL67_09785 [Magnetococcales bacterium]|nr:hypothetical protein [Magnetococcales bacterium]
MSSFYLNVHDLFIAWAESLPPEVASILNRRFEPFGHIDVPVPKSPDLILSPLTAPPSITGAGRQMEALYGFWVTSYREEPALIFFRKGAVDLMVTLSEPMHIFFRPRAGIAGKLHTALTFCLKMVLSQKGRLFAHGAVLRHRDQCLIIAGQRGIRKTQLVLTLLHHGWHYLADDKFILDRGVARRYQQRVLLRDHHFDALPWLGQRTPGYDTFKKAAPWRKRGRTLARNLLHKKLLPSEDRLFNRGLQPTIENLFPENPRLETVIPSQVILLYNGPEPSTVRLSSAEGVRDLTLMQQLAYEEFSGMEWMLGLYDKRALSDYSGLIQSNLPPACIFFKMIVPEGQPPEALINEVNTCLQSAS